MGSFFKSHMDAVTRRTLYTLNYRRTALCAEFLGNKFAKRILRRLSTGTKLTTSLRY